MLSTDGVFLLNTFMRRPVTAIVRYNKLQRTHVYRTF